MTSPRKSRAELLVRMRRTVRFLSGVENLYHLASPRLISHPRPARSPIRRTRPSPPAPSRTPLAASSPLPEREPREGRAQGVSGERRAGGAEPLRRSVHGRDQILVQRHLNCPHHTPFRAIAMWIATILYMRGRPREPGGADVASRRLHPGGRPKPARLPVSRGLISKAVGSQKVHRAGGAHRGAGRAQGPSPRDRGFCALPKPATLGLVVTGEWQKRVASQRVPRGGPCPRPTLCRHISVRRDARDATRCGTPPAPPAPSRASFALPPWSGVSTLPSR